MILHSDRGSANLPGPLSKTLKKGKALQNIDETDADVSGQKHCVPVHYDLLQPYSGLYR